MQHCHSGLTALLEQSIEAPVLVQAEAVRLQCLTGLKVTCDCCTYLNAHAAQLEALDRRNVKCRIGDKSDPRAGHERLETVSLVRH